MTLAPKVRPIFFQPRQGTGEGERTQWETRGGWSYHQSDGWKLTDHPLGDEFALPAHNQPPDDEYLESAGFASKPSLTLTPVAGFSWRITVYDRRTSVEHLVVVVTEGRNQFVLVKGFPSLLDVLERLKNIIG